MKNITGKLRLQDQEVGCTEEWPEMWENPKKMLAPLEKGLGLVLRSSWEASSEKTFCTH